MAPTCEFYSVCPFFTSTLAGDMPTTANLLKKKYCCDAYTDCARYRVTMEAGEHHVPESMFPNNESKANAIIARVNGTSDENEGDSEQDSA